MPDFAMPAWKPPCFRASESRLLRGTGLMVACGVLLISTAAATAIAQGVCNRTPQVRDKLVEEAGVSQCENVTSEHLARVTSIHLVDVSALRPGDFEGLTSLGSLFLSAKFSEFLAPGGFQRLDFAEAAQSDWKSADLLAGRCLRRTDFAAESLSVSKSVDLLARRHLQRPDFPEIS